MKIIPAIDILDGKCVRLSAGDYATRKIYNENPLEVAKEFEDHGIQYLHLVDLDGARSNCIVNYPILEKIASNTQLRIDFGGGIKSDQDLEIAFESGAQQVTGGSIAAKRPEIFLSWLSRYGSDRIVLGADCFERKIATNGWLESSDNDVLDFILSNESKGVKTVISTDVSKDGMLSGPSINLYKEILERSSVELIASGGIASLDDLQQLQQIGCSGAIIGKAIYEGKISLKQLAELC